MFSQYKWDMNQLVSLTDEGDTNFDHVYVNGESIRPIIEAMFNISVGRLQGEFIKDDSTQIDKPATDHCDQSATEVDNFTRANPRRPIDA